MLKRLIPLLFLTACVAKPWTKTDIGMEVAFGAAIAADWKQSNQIIDKCQETNPILFDWSHCNSERVPTAFYFPAIIILHGVAAHYMSQPWRSIFQGVSVGVEGDTVYNNWSEGINFW